MEKAMATHSSVLAWRLPGTGEPGGLPSLGSQRVRRLKRLSSSSSRKLIQILLALTLGQSCLDSGAMWVEGRGRPPWGLFRGSVPLAPTAAMTLLPGSLQLL